ncbi:hypothetical protein VI06_10565 [Aquitalea magnusonii]|nr:hypothetical protein VI06_10565 [Aquitalea magnusonii]
MASFRKRGELQWQARISRKNFPSQVKTFNTRADAEAWARQIESEMDRGVFVSRVEAETTTLAEALDRYLSEVVVAKKGAIQESSLIRMWQRTELAPRPMASIRSTDIAKLRDEWLKDYKPATVLRRFAVLSHVFNLACKEWGMLSLTNPVELVRKPQPSNGRVRRIATEDGTLGRAAGDGELERIIAASESDVLPSIIWLAVETAMRRSEITSLRWEHIDLKRRVAHLPDTKNGTSRDVPLSSMAVAVLKELQQPTHALEGKVFDVRSDAVTRAFERALARARQTYERECFEADKAPDGRYLVDLHFHDLRHEATSRLAAIFPMHELTKITGHKDPRMLLRYYHPRAEDLAKRLA